MTVLRQAVIQRIEDLRKNCDSSDRSPETDNSIPQANWLRIKVLRQAVIQTTEDLDQAVIQNTEDLIQAVIQKTEDLVKAVI